MSYKLELTAREAQVVYIALSSVWWSGLDAEADSAVRKQIEKIAMKKAGVSLHDYLSEKKAIEGNNKPDIRTDKEKQADIRLEINNKKLSSVLKELRG